MVSTLKPTPQPRVEAKTIDTTPSSRALTISSWAWPGPPRPSWIDPRMVRGPTQNTRLAVTKPSTKVESAPTGGPGRSKRRRTASPRVSTRSSRPTASPTAPPTTRATSGNTMFRVLKASWAPMTRVVRPTPWRTVSRTRSGRRRPATTPAAVPASTVSTFTSVPTPRTGRRYPDARCPPCAPAEGPVALGERFDEILAAAQKGAPWALEAIYREFQPGVLAFMRARAGGEAEDLAADVFVAAAEGLPRFEGGEAGFRSWLYTIAYRKVGQLRRRQGRRKTEPAPIGDVVEHVAPGDAEADAMAVLATRA